MAHQLVDDIVAEILPLLDIRSLHSLGGTSQQWRRVAQERSPWTLTSQRLIEVGLVTTRDNTAKFDWEYQQPNITVKQLKTAITKKAGTMSTPTLDRLVPVVVGWVKRRRWDAVTLKITCLDGPASTAVEHHTQVADAVAKPFVQSLSRKLITESSYAPKFRTQESNMGKFLDEDTTRRDKECDDSYSDEESEEEEEESACDDDDEDWVPGLSLGTRLEAVIGRKAMAFPTSVGETTGQFLERGGHVCVREEQSGRWHCITIRLTNYEC